MYAIRSYYEGAEQLRHEAHAAETTQRLAAEDTGGNAAPGATEAVQRPDTEHIVDPQTVLCHGKGPDEEGPGHTTHDQGTEWVHHIGTGAHGHQTSYNFV